MPDTSRQYELVLFGATGYTGKLTAEHITKHLPTDLKWAIAGRSHQKLSAVVDKLKSINPDRPPPDIEIAELNKAELVALAKKTRLLISTVGPYHVYGTPVIAACAENATHYIDCTGEYPWVKDMIGQYHEVAKSSGTVMIPQCGVDSVPADIMVWLLVKLIREKLNVGVTESVHSIQRFIAKGSGGTLNTVFALMDNYTPQQLAAATKPFALSPVEHPNPTISYRSVLSKILGVRTIPDLGVQTSAPQHNMDAAIVGRSWGLFDKGEFYGPRFSFTESFRARNALTGFLWFYCSTAAMLTLLLPPVRWIGKKLIYQPGEGPEMDTTIGDEVTYRTVAYPDQEGTPTKKRAIGNFSWSGSMYALTGVMIAEAAMVILRGDGNTYAQKQGGGMLTPATLGDQFVERLQKQGLKIDARLEDQF